MKQSLTALILVGLMSLGSCMTSQPFDFDKSMRKIFQKELNQLRENDIDRVSIDYDKRYALDDKRFHIDQQVEIQQEWDIPQEQAMQILALLRQNLRLPPKYTLTTGDLHDPSKPTYFMALKFYQGDKLIAKIKPLYIGSDSESSYQLDAKAEAELVRIIEEQLKTKGFSSPFPKDL